MITSSSSNPWADSGADLLSYPLERREMPFHVGESGDAKAPCHREKMRNAAKMGM